MTGAKRSRRRVFPDERRLWLEKHESGTSLSALANQTGRNMRTIKKHLQQASDERERVLARTDLYRQAITKHNADLLTALGSVRESLWVPHDEHITVLPYFRDNLASSLPRGDLGFSRGRFSSAAEWPHR